jgi:transcriptional regulator with XRE-family HTH domain
MVQLVHMDIRRLVGRNVKRVRLEKRLSQEQFAERAGFSQQYLSDLERGLRNPTIVTLYELARALEVDHIVLVAPDEEAQRESEGRGKRAANAASTKPESRTASKAVAGRRAKPPRRNG